MKAAGMILAIVGYAMFYAGASNLFTGGQGWGFLQSLLNRGEANSGLPSLSGGQSSSGGTVKLGPDPCRFLIGPAKKYCHKENPVPTG